MSERPEWTNETGYVVRAIAHPEEEGGWSVISTNLPGCASQGETLEEAKANFREAAQAVIETYKLLRKPIAWGEVEVRRQVEIQVVIED